MNDDTQSRPSAVSNVPKVLVVDDEDELANFLAKSIAKHEVLAKPCYSGKEAVEFLKVEKFAAVLTDMRMPHMDGLELIDWIRDNVQPQPAIFILTGYADENRRVLDDLNLDGIFQKPADVKPAVQAVVAAAKRA